MLTVMTLTRRWKALRIMMDDLVLKRDWNGVQECAEELATIEREIRALDASSGSGEGS